MTDYRGMIETIIKRQMETVGAPVALRQARKVPDLQISDDGDVEALNGPGEIVLREVLETYEEVSGPVATAINTTALKKEFGDDIVDAIPDTDGS